MDSASPSARWAGARDTPFAPWALAVGLLTPLCFKVIADPDPAWHLALGRLIATSGLPHTNALAWTGEDSPWYDTSWLWDWGAYHLVRLFGLAGVQALTLCTAAAALGFLGWSCRSIGPLRGAWVLPAVALVVAGRATPRPLVATWLAIAVVTALCLAGRGRSWLWRAGCVPAVVVASNLHSGAIFAAGVLGMFCLQELWLNRRPIELGIAALGVAGLCANPGGLFDLRSMIFHLDVRQVVSIAEYRPASLGRDLGFFLELPIVLACAWRLRREVPALLASVVIFGALALRANRMIFDFQWVAAPVVARALSDLSARVPAAGSWSAIGALAFVAIWPTRYDRQLRQARWAPAWDQRVLPTRAAAFAEAEHLRGRLFNSYEDGGYLEWALASTPAFIDGRVQAFPPGLFARFYAAERDPAAFRAWMQELGVEWAIVPRATSATLSGVHLFEGVPEWALVYWDDLSEVYLRRDAPQFAALIDRYEYRHFQPVGSIVGGIAALPREELRPYIQEVMRYEQTSPDDFFAEAVRCALQTRANAPGTPACERANSLAPSERLKALVGKARATPPLP